MNILFDINHPAHVHLFRNAIGLLEQQGHTVTVASREKDVVINLLDNFNIPHIVLSKAQKNLFCLGMELLVRNIKFLGLLRKKKIDVCVAATGASSGIACKFLGMPQLVFYDSEHARLQNTLSIPLATEYITPDCYKANGGKRHVTYAGVHELAYLHPDHFSPDKSILKECGLTEEEPFIIIRFVAWNASHDQGFKGLSRIAKEKIISDLSQCARVIILSETPLEKNLDPYRYKGPTDKILDLMSYSSLHIGEGATMVSESACLGVPAIYINPLKLGYIEMEQAYGLVFDLNDASNIIRKAKDILLVDQSVWSGKLQKFLSEKINVTQWMVDRILTQGKK